MRLDDREIARVLAPLPARFARRRGLRAAAVLAPLFERAGADHLLYTLRRADLPEHGGELSFPGGGREGGESPAACALREAGEEIGLPAESVRLLGALPPRPSLHGRFVHCLVGRIPGTEGLRPAPDEVDRLVAIPVAALADSSRWHFRRLTNPPGPRTMPFFPAGGVPLWGLTALFTRELLRRLDLLR